MKALLLITITAPLLAYAMSTTTGLQPETPQAGMCLPFDGHEAYEAYCAPLTKEACEANAYVCTWQDGQN